MKLNSTLGRVSIALLKLVEDPELLDEEKRASNRVKIAAADKVIISESVQLNNELQYARMAEREARILNKKCCNE